MRTFAIFALVALAGCAATPQQTARAEAVEEARSQKLAAALAGLVPGQPVSCLPSLPGNRSSTTIGATILYQDSPGLIYRNDTSGGCESMERGDYIVTVSSAGGLCRGDIGRTFDSVSRIPTGSCALGSFVPYRRQ